MRKILMAATAMFSVGMLASHAQAQGMPAQPLTTDDFTAANVSTGAAAPAPGTVTVTLRFKDWTDVGYGSDSGTVGKNPDGTKNGSKQQNFQIQNFFRIYPRLSATAANGLSYGVQAEIRQNSGYGGSQFGNASNGNPGNSLVINKALAYVSLPTVGTVSVGGAALAMAQFAVGDQTDWDAANGGWNGDSPDFVSGGAALSWTEPGNSGTYRTNKIVYVSPKFSGFDFGASFEPSFSVSAQGANSFGQAGATAGVGGLTTSTSGCTTITTTGCAVSNPGTLTSSILTTTPGGQGVRKNSYDFAARYTGSFGAIATTIEGGYWGSGVVGNSTKAQVYKGISLVDVGAKFVIGNLEFGAHYDFGSISGGGYQPKKAGTHNEDAFVGGAEYIIGQGMVGVQYINEISAGGNGSTGTKNGLHEVGVAFGGSYAYAPGAEAYLSILYGVRHQAGVDLLNGAPGANNNNTTARAVGIGNRFSF